MTSVLLTLTLIALTVTAQASALNPVALRVEYSENPLGIDASTPRLSWRSTSEIRDATQSAYQIQAAATLSDLTGGILLWDSGPVKSNQSLFIPYEGPALDSGNRVVWRVKLWDQDGRASDWSDTAFWETGLLNPEDWQSLWIRPEGPPDTSEQRPVVLLRKAFTLAGDVKQARLYATARGIYELELNGKPIGDQVLAPGWTSYDHRIQYQTYDVTELLNTGANAVGATVAHG